MRVKQKVAALCLAAVMAASVGAAAFPNPPAELGKWVHGYLPGQKMAYSYFGFNPKNTEVRIHTAWAQVGRNCVIVPMRFSQSNNGTLRPEAEAFNNGTGDTVQNYWYKIETNR